MKRIYIIAAVICTMMSFSSCSDFFDEDSTYIIPADKDRFNNATDTIYSVTGILNKLQAIADRTVLFGEARADLMDITSATSSDLRDLAMFKVGDDNEYNAPRDYYAIINNCNYFIAHADTALKNNRNENVFKAEYAAVKAIRAWTYLQLVTTYGKVPFVTTPILTKEEAERTYPTMDILGVCDYFLNQDNLQSLVDQEYPNYGDIKSLPSPMFFVPMRLILGDLSLWAGRYMDAAQYYYGYINNRNGQNSSYPTGLGDVHWSSSQWLGLSSSLNLTSISNTIDSEIITVIPMDSIPSEGYYSQLRNIFNTTSDNDYKASLIPSQGIIDLSAAQSYYYYDSETNKYMTTPKGMTWRDYLDGDLRLSRFVSKSDNAVDNNGNRYTSWNITKQDTRNGAVRTYRRTLVYLRLAEALNCAGYPHFAYHILATGVNKKIVCDSIGKYYSKEDSTMLANTFPFPEGRYVVYVPHNSLSNANTMGIHSRGCGYSAGNPDYQMPVNAAITDPQELRLWQQQQVEEMIVNEGALEFAFEGYRFYDLMRVAMRKNDPSYLADKIYGRRGAGNVNAMKAELPDLTDMNNWFIKCNGEIGIELQ